MSNPEQQYLLVRQRKLQKDGFISMQWLDICPQLLSIFINMILDTVLLTSLLAGLHYYKGKHPNFLFFPQKAVLFLPPEDKPENRPKKKKEKMEPEVNVIKIEYENVKDYPFNNQFSRVMMTTVGLVLFVLLKLIVNLVWPGQSLLTFYVLALIIVYTIKIGIDTFFLTNYNRKNCFLIALAINFIFYLFTISFDSMEGVIDQTIKSVAADFTKHLEIIFNREITFITHKTILGLVFFVNFFIVIAVIPSIIKFGNWYAKTLKQVYYEDEGSETLAMARRADSNKQVDVKEQEKQLKIQSKQIISKLNTYLALMLLIIFLSHRYIQNYLEEGLVDALRGISMGVCCYIIAETMSKAIQFNGSFAYKYVLQFFETDDTEKRAEIRKKIAPFIYYIWYHFFQFVIRMFIPILLFLLIVNWKYLSPNKEIVTGNFSERALNTDIECPLSTDHLAILESLYRCPVNATISTRTSAKYFLNGVLETIPTNLEPSSIQSNIQEYGILNKSIMVEICEHLFWYSSLSIYLMTVAYILFLRKTVYDI